MLFADLPEVPPHLDVDERTLLAALPDYEVRQTVTALHHEAEIAIARRLERLGLVHIHWWKEDTISTFRTPHAGRTAAGTAALAAQSV